MAAEMMSGDLPVTSDADAMAKQKAKEADLVNAATMLTGGANKRKAGEVCIIRAYWKTPTVIGQREVATVGQI